MKKTIFFIAAIFSIGLYAQNTEPKMEKVGDLVKATYYHENGTIAQTGYFLENKLHGHWLKYDAEGKKVASGKYVDGKKSGKWFFWEGEKLKEVDYVANEMVNVKNWNESEIVSVDK
ncbi:toxin-antitoxin system YwqK family antitoxin [Flagellimonas myxillae]|uniref:toxin-antitoxin system YwqK family antitoxin n=1 Tax=Flagellimonas myxillae TaxID=2942214 RepID=UPI00201EB172|nr:nicotinic acid mononucleotide adenyltransferase [Muricauda myxillae]MCL6266867.1 nicotinic acid mononucleotide adenyltransferase [Muricauda myxillae]